jgi:hypothetical protein
VHWFIDVGAGGGELCLVFKKAGTKIIIAAEPQASEVALFHENVTANGLDPSGFTMINKFIGTKCNWIGLDEIRVDPNQPGFIKIDVDGAELDVLKSSAGLLKSATDLAILVETHSATLEHSCKAYLEQCGFEAFVIRNAWWRFVIPEQRPIAHNRWIWARKR